MRRKSSRRIAALISSLLILLYVVLGVLSGLLAGHNGFSKYFNDHPWFNLVLAIVVSALIICLITVWKENAGPRPATREDLDAATLRMLEAFRESALQRGDIPAQSAQDRDAEIARLTGELLKLQQQVAQRSSEPPEARLSKLLQARDLDGALSFKLQAVELGRVRTANLPRDLSELGTIHELRFEWPQALDAYREAWKLEKDPEYGFKYALLSQKLNHFEEAIGTYEAVLPLYTDPAFRAFTLNNLAVLYRSTQRMAEAENAYGEAISTFRKLSETDPGTYLPNVANSLNNLGTLYQSTQRAREAEESYTEALGAFRKLAGANPDAFLPNVAISLNNLAALHGENKRISLAKEECDEALAIYRELAKDNADSWMPELATSLDNLAKLYTNTLSMNEAEDAFSEALSILRELARRNPEAFSPELAATLNNLALMYSVAQRFDEADGVCREAERILEPIWAAHPAAHGNRMARILAMRAQLSSVGQNPNREACTFAHRALVAAYDPELKRSILEAIDRLCPES